MTIKAQNDNSHDQRIHDYWESLACRLSDRLLEQELRADDYQAWSLALGFWAVLATAVAILEAVT